MVRATFEKKLGQLDLEPIMFSLVKAADGPHWDFETACVVEKWYRRFHTLYFLHPEALLVPDKMIDTFWHYHILDTQKYYEDCILLHGHILHHFPYFGVRDEDDRKALEKSYGSTLALYAAEFGERPQYRELSSMSVEAGVLCGAGGSDCSKGDSSIIRTNIRPKINLQSMFS